MIHDALARWANFYLITGTAAAALTGLQFVVQTLLASGTLRSVTQGDPESGIAAFGTPTVVHFSLSLLLSAVLCAPWPQYASLCATLGAGAAAALVYSAIVVRRALRQRVYTPTLYDWVWHTCLPALAYGMILAASIMLGSAAEWPFFLVAAATMLLLCVGIHNAWDTVTYLTVAAMQSQ